MLQDRRSGPTWRQGRRGAVGTALGVLRRAARDLSRTAVDAVKQSRWRRRRVATIREYLSAHPAPGLHLGSGPVLLPGWLNADLRPRTAQHVFIDALERLPFDDGVFQYVLTEHMIGDFTYQQCAHVLAECFRVLRPGGRLRLSTPDLERLIELYSVPRSPEEEHYLRWTIEENAQWADAYLPGFVINNFFQEYAFVYDGAVLTQQLRVAGFDEIVFVEPGASDTPALRGIDAHGSVVGDERINRFEVITVEAVKPGPGGRAGNGRG